MDTLLKQVNSVLSLNQIANNTTDGGAKLTKKGLYKKQLNKYTLQKIQSYAKKHNIVCTKRVNGKIIKLSKSSLINKIANKKFK